MGERALGDTSGSLSFCLFVSGFGEHVCGVILWFGCCLHAHATPCSNSCLASVVWYIHKWWRASGYLLLFADGSSLSCGALYPGKPW